jgi:hypothetical protein
MHLCLGSLPDPSSPQACHFSGTSFDRPIGPSLALTGGLQGVQYGKKPFKAEGLLSRAVIRRPRRSEGVPCFELCSPYQASMQHGSGRCFSTIDEHTCQVFVSMNQRLAQGTRIGFIDLIAGRHGCCLWFHTLSKMQMPRSRDCYSRHECVKQEKV